MSKTKKAQTKRTQGQIMSDLLRKDYVDALREGRRQRAATFTDRKKQANRKACRGRVTDHG
jgi:hypothetical protein